MNYIEIKITVQPFVSENGDLFSALLAEMDYESFVENEDGISAFIPEKNYNEAKLTEMLSNFKDAFSDLNFSTKVIKGENWNQKWEENFEPLLIDGFCSIKAPFHQIKKSYPHEIIITPKMSFGTGHHSTTASMIRLMNMLNFNSLEVLDMGCGTGILSIFAAQKKAKKILAVDIDGWAYSNSIENVKLNNINNIEVQQGGEEVLKNKKFDVILANINRNVLLEQMNTYSDCLNDKGQLLLSGFYTEDLPMIKIAAEKKHLIYQKHLVENNWIAALFCK